MKKNQKILEVKDLSVTFEEKKRYLVLDRINLDLFEGETLGIVGESGSGKSILSQSLVKLNSSPIYEGQILYQKEDLFKKSAKELRAFRGNSFAYIFQDPLSSLTPTMKIGHQILEGLKIKSKDKVIQLLKEVGLENMFDLYPHQLSGGQRQRVMIAIALACDPKILIADEPTTALDVTIQAQILDLFKTIQKKGMSIIFISHDLKIICSIAHRIIVLYGGRILEEAKKENLIQNPLHPYTQLLFLSIPKLSESKDHLHTIEGSLPDLSKPIEGCIFASRCPKRKEICFSKSPPFSNKDEHKVACWSYENS